MAISAAHDLLSGFGRSSADQEFEKMYRRHAEDVFRYALLVLRSRADAEDVTQATFLRAYRAVTKGERVRKPQHWLITIAHNECRRLLRKTSRRSIEVELDEAFVSAPEPVDGPTAEEIRKALSHLSFNQRAALVMRELEDRSYAEIAEVLQLTTSAVETLLFRARRSLREQMEGAVPCAEVEGLLLKQIDGEIGADERRVLRAHTRSCATCATLERQHRGRKAALKRLGSMITLPSSLGSFVGGGSGAVATGAGVAIGVKAAAAVVAAVGIATAGAATVRLAPGASRTARPGRTIADAAAVRTVVAAQRSAGPRAADAERAAAAVAPARRRPTRSAKVRRGTRGTRTASVSAVAAAGAAQALAPSATAAVVAAAPEPRRGVGATVPRVPLPRVGSPSGPLPVPAPPVAAPPVTAPPITPPVPVPPVPTVSVPSVPTVPTPPLPTVTTPTVPAITVTTPPLPPR